jgi:hypothetical protein
MRVVSVLSEVQNIYEQKTAKRVCDKKTGLRIGIGTGFNPNKWSRIRIPSLEKHPWELKFFVMV